MASTVDAFSVLFFVSVGMLFDPGVLLDEPLKVLAVVAIIMLGKTLASVALVVVFRYPLNSALTVGASLAQIDEFSFILAGLGVALKLLPVAWLARRSRSPRNRCCSARSTARRISFVVAEQNRGLVEMLHAQGVPALSGDASDAAVLVQAHIAQAAMLVIATPDTLGVRTMVEVARALNPGIEVIVRSPNAEEAALLAAERVGEVFIGEHELARGMAGRVLTRMGRAGAALH